MPGGITLLQSTPADIPTPGANKDTIFIDITASPNPAPAYKDSSGVTRPLVGATGAQGPTGPMIPLEEGPAGEDGFIGPPGPAGTAAPTNVVLFAKTSLTNGQIAVLNGTPVAVVPAPGAGKANHLISMTIEVVVSVGYTSTPNWSMVYGTNATNLFTATFSVPLNVAGTYQRAGTLLASAENFTYATFDPTNKALNIKMDANPTGAGTATATVHVAYFISTTP